MKSPIHAYLSGPMTGLTVAEAMAWVREAHARLEAAGYECYSPIETETAHLPDDYVIQPEGNDDHPLSRREAFFHFDRHEVKRSDILFVNVTPLKDDAHYSLGSDWEMCWASENDTVIVLVARPGQIYAQHGFIKAAGALIFYTQEEALRFLEAYAGAS